MEEPHRRFIEKSKSLAERLDFELPDGMKDCLLGYLVHWTSQTFGVVVKEGYDAPFTWPMEMGEEYVNIIHERDIKRLKPGYVIIQCTYQHET
jgi:hypothetical protein